MTWQRFAIIAVFIAVLYNLGAALYYMMVDKGQSTRTVNSLTWRIGLSVALIVLVAIGLVTGVIESHGIRVGR
jgi:small neutral amino acid transporter SnatA (MarC family)